MSNFYIYILKDNYTNIINFQNSEYFFLNIDFIYKYDFLI